MSKKSAVDLIIRSLRDHADEWHANEYRLTHRPTDTQVWIANGALFVRVGVGFESITHNGPNPLRPWQKIRIWCAFKAWDRKRGDSARGRLDFEQAARLLVEHENKRAR